MVLNWFRNPQLPSCSFFWCEEALSVTVFDKVFKLLQFANDSASAKSCWILYWTFEESKMLVKKGKVSTYTDWQYWWWHQGPQAVSQQRTKLFIGKWKSLVLKKHTSKHISFYFFDTYGAFLFNALQNVILDYEELSIELQTAMWKWRDKCKQAFWVNVYLRPTCLCL